MGKHGHKRHTVRAQEARRKQKKKQSGRENYSDFYRASERKTNLMNKRKRRGEEEWGEAAAVGVGVWLVTVI